MNIPGSNTARFICGGIHVVIAMAEQSERLADYDRSEQSNGGIRYEVNELLAKNNRAYIFVREIFHYPDSETVRCGVTGSQMVSVTQEEANRRLDEMRDYEYSPLAHVYDDIDTPKSWDSWIDEQIQHEGVRLVLDDSYTHKFGDVVREKAKEESDIDAEYVECIGGGRMFRGQDFDIIYDQELLALVQDVEEGEVF